MVTPLPTPAECLPPAPAALDGLNGAGGGTATSPDRYHAKASLHPTLQKYFMYRTAVSAANSTTMARATAMADISHVPKNDRALDCHTPTPMPNSGGSSSKNTWYTTWMA